MKEDDHRKTFFNRTFFVFLLFTCCLFYLTIFCHLYMPQSIQWEKVVITTDYLRRIWQQTWHFSKIFFEICLTVSGKLWKPISNKSSRLRIKSDTTHIQSRLLLIAKPTVSFASYTFPLLKCRLLPIFLPCLPWMSNISFYTVFIFSNYVHLHVTAIVLYSYSFHHLFDDSYDPVIQYPISSNFSRDSP